VRESEQAYKELSQMREVQSSTFANAALGAFLRAMRSDHHNAEDRLARASDERSLS
jgi:hypothetical protein